MALSKDFSNVVVNKEKKREITKLTQLKEGDKDTIFNLIFTEALDDKVKE